MFTNDDKLMLLSQLGSLAEGAGVAALTRSAVFERYKAHYGYSALLRKFDCCYTASTFESKGNNLVGHLWWQPKAVATAIIAHGLFDHTGLYLKLVAELLSIGLNVASVDFVGHGLSEGEPTAVDDFNEYGRAIADFRDVLSKAWPIQFGGPVYLVGQSTGCSAITCYLAKYDTPVKAVVFFAPLLRPHGWWLVNFSYWLAHRYLRKIPRKHTTNSHDADFLQFLYNSDALQSKSLHISWVKAMRRWVKSFSALPCINVPTLIVQGDNDHTVDWRFNIPNFLCKFISSNVHYIPTAMHQIVNENEKIRSQALSACRQFIEKNT